MKLAPPSQEQHDQHGQQDELSHDPIWDLLRQSPSVDASPAFADRVLRAVRHQEHEQAPSFWQKLISTPVWARSALAGTALASVAALAIFALPNAGSFESSVTQMSGVDEFAVMDEVASQEVLLAATDHLNEFSDLELVSLIGF